jgi:uncharacterized paraquat-inducible protein A
MQNSPDITAQLHTCHHCHQPNLVPTDTPPTARVHCHRCDAPLRPWTRSLHNNRLAALFAILGLVFYLPAMTIPLMSIRRFGFANEVGLIDGVTALFHHGNLLLGLILLVCSVFLPLGKLVGLLLLSTRGPALSAKPRSTLFHLIEFTGRFSILDVLLVAVLIAIVKVGDLVTVTPGPGLIAFAAVVLFSLLAAWAFDPDAIWEPRHD